MRKTNSEKIEKKQTYVLPTLKYFFPAAWKTDKAFFILSVIHVIVTAAIPFAELFFLPTIIDAMMAPEKDLAFIFTNAAIMVILDISLRLASSVLGCHLEKYEDKFLNSINEEIAKRCMEIDFALTENKEALDQINKARDGLDWSGGTYRIATTFFGLISKVITLLGVITLLVISAPWLLLIIGSMLAVSAALNKKKNKVEIEWFSRLSLINRVFGYVIFELEDFRFGKDIRLYGASGMMVEKATQQIKRLMKGFEDNTWKTYPISILDVASSALRDFGTYFYLGALAILGHITIGVFSQLTNASGVLYEAVSGIIFGLQDIVKYTNYGYEIVKFMNYPPYLEKGDKKIERLAGEHTIEFRDVSFTYPNTAVQILSHVSIKLKTGDKLSVVGLNGAGKTTFIKLLCRLYDVDDGEILFDGVNIKEYDYDEYMKLFSVVFQDFRLLAFSVKDNILLGKEDESGRVGKLLEQVGLKKKVESLPKGEDTTMFRAFDKNGVELSGGEQQKLALARALYKDAPVVILDEPTAALDPVAEYEIYRQFNDIVGGKTAVYISHRLSSCKFCDKIAVFSGGTIAEYGTHDELVHKQDGIYAEMFHAQAQYYV